MNKLDPSAPVQLDTSLTTKQLIDIRAEAIRIIEATNKAIAFGYFAGNLVDKFGDIQKCQDVEFMNVHNAVDAILDSLGMPLVGDDMPISVSEIDGKFIPFVSIKDNQSPTNGMSITPHSHQDFWVGKQPVLINGKLEIPTKTCNTKQDI